MATPAAGMTPIVVGIHTLRPRMECQVYRLSQPKKTEACATGQHTEFLVPVLLLPNTGILSWLDRLSLNKTLATVLTRNKLLCKDRKSTRYSDSHPLCSTRRHNTLKHSPSCPSRWRWHQSNLLKLLSIRQSTKRR